MRTLFVLCVLPIVLSCDDRGVRVVSCALTDEKLAVAIKDPVAAEAYLVGLSERLKAADPEAAKEAADLATRLAECVR